MRPLMYFEIRDTNPTCKCQQEILHCRKKSFAIRDNMQLTVILQMNEKRKLFCKNTFTLIELIECPQNFYRNIYSNRNIRMSINIHSCINFHTNALEIYTRMYTIEIYACSNGRSPGCSHPS